MSDFFSFGIELRRKISIYPSNLYRFASTPFFPVSAFPIFFITVCDQRIEIENKSIYFQIPFLSIVIV